MKRFNLLFIILFLLILLVVNYFFRITIDYDLVTKKEKKITPLEYYFFYNKNHYVRKNFKLNNFKDSVLIFEYEEDDKVNKIKYFKNKFGGLIKYLTYDSNENYELPSFDRVVIYDNKYTIFLEKPISINKFVKGYIFKNNYKNTYRCFQLSFKEPILMDEIKNINFDNYTNFNVDYNTLIIFDIDNNVFYGVNDNFDFKESFKIDKQNQFDLNNAHTINSPFFEPMGGKDFYDLIHGFN